jgi:hypothetical protein
MQNKTWVSQDQLKDKAQLLEQVRLMLMEVIRHGYGDVIIKVQDGKVITIEKREVYKPG